MKNKIRSAKEMIEYGDIAEACDQLESTYKKTDGKPKPSDFVSGSATEELAAMILELKASLGCS